MPIVVVLLAFAALVYGAYWSYNAIAVQFGTGVAVGAAVLAAALFVALIAWWWRRRRDVAHRNGDVIEPSDLHLAKILYGRGPAP